LWMVGSGTLSLSMGLLVSAPKATYFLLGMFNGFVLPTYQFD